MSLETSIDALTKAIEANTAALKSGGGASSGGGGSTYTPKHDKSKMQAALSEVKEKLGTPAAKAMIKDVGGKDKMADITDPATIDRVYEAATKALAEAADGGM